MGFVTQTGNLRHPARPFFAEELSLGWQLLRVIQSSVCYVSEFIRSLFLL